jgi:peroxiredoxin family protein
MMAVILESGEPERMYTALSLLVSAASDGEEARGLVSFGALERLKAGGFPGHGGVFFRTLQEMLQLAGELEACRMWACAAAAEVNGITEPPPPLEGIMSTPRFLKETEGARLVVV